jgi:hypothetical protein
MGVEADINWIKRELDFVKDPLLIETFKNLLNYRRKYAAFDDPQLDLDRMIEEGEDDIQKGDFLNTDELRSKVSSWKK